MNIPTAIKKILVHNHWDEFNFQIMQDYYADKLKQSYSKFDYPLNEGIINKIALFYNMKLELNQSDILYFDVKKIKKYRQEAMQKVALKLGVNKVIYLQTFIPAI